MAFWNRKTERRAATLESETVKQSDESILALFGLRGNALPAVTIDTALTVMPVWSAATFLSRTMAALPLHAYRDSKNGPSRLTGKTAVTIHEFPNDEMDTFHFREYFWFQVFTGGRGLAFIEREGKEVANIWPMDPSKVSIRRNGLRLSYIYQGVAYESSEVIDVAYAMKQDQTHHYGPISVAKKAIQLSLAMSEYGASFFAGGGVPPLALTGPLPQGADGLKRAMTDMNRSISAARSGSAPVFPIPPGHELKPVGFDPEKGQMVEAMRMQTEEIARAYQLPPVFLQDLSRATFSNAEQQDLHFVKHLVGQWAKKFEGEMTLKLFTRSGRDRRYVEHSLDGLLRGDLLSRMDAHSKSIQNAIRTPNEVRGLEGLAPKPNGDDLLIQGATVPIGQANDGAPVNSDNGEQDDET